MEGHRIRESFLSFFEERDHKRVQSSSLIPPPESGLLLTNAGMNQFIPYFLGQASAPYPRAVTSQKVMRTNDIENVGHDARHETFFEMLGNFSFADYFKAEAITWAHELITEGYGIDHDLLWVTVYDQDEEAASAWVDLAGIAPDRIVRRGKLDEEGELANYWHTHAAGPAGPCSEIFVDRGPRYGPDGGPDVDEERFMEIWNLVFMQEQVDGDLEVVAPLPGKNVDTGSSLERVAMILQGVDNVFETDLFSPTLEEAERRSGKRHGEDPNDDVSLKIVAEHGRATTFLIADGVQPSNEGRGYILRRMLRRAVSHGRRLGIEGSVLDPIITTVIDGFGDAYPELRENEAFVRQVADSEEDRFSATLGKGLVLFEDAKGRAEGSRISGDDAFALSDTFGIPREQIQEWAAEAGLTVDTDRFAELLQEQRDRARAARKKVEVGLEAGAVPPTEFVGYHETQAETPIALVLDEGSEQLEAAEEGQAVRVFLDRTPFYAEGGGQVGDQGLIRTDTGMVRVTDTVPAGGHATMHVGTVESGEIRPGQVAHAAIDVGRRDATARAHTSTHVVHWTLKQVLGEHARQAGSLVAPGRLRFDFRHPNAVPLETLEGAELEANRRLAMDDEVRATEMSMDEAKGLGAVGAVRREVRRHGPRRGDRGLFQGAVRRHPRASHGPCRGGAHPARGFDRLRDASHRGARGPRRPARDQYRTCAAAWPRRGRRVERPGHGRRARTPRSSRRTSASRASSAAFARGTAMRSSPPWWRAPSRSTGWRWWSRRSRGRIPAACATWRRRSGTSSRIGRPRSSWATARAARRCWWPRSPGPPWSEGSPRPAILATAATVIGGGAGGKDILANAGGKHPERVPDALGGIPARLEELLGAR